MRLRKQLVTHSLHGKLEANIYELSLLGAILAFEQPSAGAGFLDVLSKGKVRFLPQPVPPHEWEGGSNQVELGGVTSCSQGRAVSPASGTSWCRHRATVAGLWREVHVQRWEGWADLHRQDITPLPLPDCLSQSSHGRCSASCWGKPWTLSVHLPQLAFSGQQSVRGCCASWALSSWTTPSQQCRGPETPDAQMKPFFVEVKGQETAALTGHVLDPNITGEWTVGALKGLGCRKDRVMSWDGSCHQGVLGVVARSIGCHGSWGVRRPDWCGDKGRMLLDAWPRCWFCSPHMLCAGYTPRWAQGWCRPSRKPTVEWVGFLIQPLDGAQAGDEGRCWQPEEMQAPWRCLRPRRAVLLAGAPESVLSVSAVRGGLAMAGWVGRCKKVDGWAGLWCVPRGLWEHEGGLGNFIGSISWLQWPPFSHASLSPWWLITAAVPGLRVWVWAVCCASEMPASPYPPPWTSDSPRGDDVCCL